MPVRPFSRRATAVAIALAGAAFLSACSGGSAAPEPSTSATAAPATAELETITPGVLTIATGDPAYSPWVLDNDPAGGQGFEAAVAYAVAEELGFADDEVVWVRTSFESAIAPGPKDWDLNIQQFSISDERKKAVDFSSPYYTTTQAVVTTEDSPAASADSIAALKEVTVGVASASTSYTVAAEALGTDNLSPFNSNEDAVLALTSGQVDAIVVDLPTAFYLAAAELDGGKIVGQFADSSGGDQFGFVLPKGSALTEPVTEAVDALRDNGTLADLETEWLSETTSVPVLN